MGRSGVESPENERERLGCDTEEIKENADEKTWLGFGAAKEAEDGRDEKASAGENQAGKDVSAREDLVEEQEDAECV